LHGGFSLGSVTIPVGKSHMQPKHYIDFNDRYILKSNKGSLLDGLDGPISMKMWLPLHNSKTTSSNHKLKQTRVQGEVKMLRMWLVFKTNRSWISNLKQHIWLCRCPHIFY
jgi:hypothetical protein